jgi:hypothetical protein
MERLRDVGGFDMATMCTTEPDQVHTLHFARQGQRPAQHPMVFVLDLDETVISARSSTIAFRPMANELIRRVVRCGGIVGVWTAADALQLLNFLWYLPEDVRAAISFGVSRGRWFSQAGNAYTKNINTLSGMPTRCVVLIDNTVQMGREEPQQFIHVPNFVWDGTTGAAHGNADGALQTLLDALVVVDSRRSTPTVLREITVETFIRAMSPLMVKTAVMPMTGGRTYVVVQPRSVLLADRWNMADRRHPGSDPSAGVLTDSHLCNNIEKKK